MRISFNEVAIKGVKRWKENGKQRQITKKFWQTVNPFNKNADGSIKDQSQILAELIARRDEWMRLPPESTGEQS